MLDRYTINIDKEFLPLFKRFVEAVERLAPPATPQRTKEESFTNEDDFIDLSEDEYARKRVQWELDDLVETLGAEMGEEDKERVQKLRERLVELEESKGVEEDD